MPSVGWSPGGQESTSSTFQLEISLPSPTIHVDQNPAIRIVFSNPTDHIVWTSNVIGLEILNNKGEAIAPQAMKTDNQANSGFVLGGKVGGWRPKSKRTFTWQPKLEPGSLAPGTYKLRVYERDAKSKVEVYSNSVKLTVLR